MNRRMWTLAAVLILLLSGCSHSMENLESKEPSQNRKVPAITVEKAEPEKTDAVVLQEASEDSVSKIPRESEGRSGEQPLGETVVIEKKTDEAYRPQSDPAEPLPGESDQQETDPSFQEVESYPEADGQEDRIPQETAKPEETDQEPDTETEDTGQEENPTDPVASKEPEQETEPQNEEVSFDINYWISFAKGLAEGKGLRLDPSAIECWDNPITANADCIYLERDLNTRLNMYAGDDEITDVWIWYEDLGNQQYLIYIGYA